MAVAREKARFSGGQASSSTAARGGQDSSKRIDVSGRAVVFLVIFAAIAAVFLVRLIDFQVIMAPEYSADATATRTMTQTVAAHRGTIFDRNGNVLAQSIRAVTISANPKQVTDVVNTAAALASILGGDIADYRDKLSEKDSEFVYIERQADADKADKLKQLNMEGIYFQDVEKRVYPYGQIGGQVVGVVDIDGQGMSGLEYYYNDTLSGTPGTIKDQRGADGVPIPNTTIESTPPVDGQDIYTTIDINLQGEVENDLVNGVGDIEGKGGSAIVMNAANGEIYACASLPLFNPADTSTIEPGAQNLSGITDAFEPGSIFKTVTLTSILENGALQPADTLFCPEYLYADGYTISDAHPRDDETMTLKQIVEHSSNVGMSLAAQQLGFDKLYQSILAYNLNAPTNVDYPGLSNSMLADVGTWTLAHSYNISFGQGVTVTPLQMVRFYGALVNDGVECTPHFLMSTSLNDIPGTYPTTQVIQNTSVIPQVTDVLEGVVSEGTAT
ncbi:MAG: penicillin-binding protein 2, partial [Eggerthellaceae bacterium]|nr:penicillin-binding protein 2 [Eggerthellaceae bacterium]